MSVELFRHELTNELLRLGKSMHDETLFKTSNWNPDKCVRLMNMPSTFSALYKHSDGAYIGFVAGYVRAQYFGDDKVACDYALYVLPKYRSGFAAVRLVSAFEAWAISQGAKSICIAPSVDRPESEEFLNRLGYATIGAVTRKEI